MATLAKSLLASSSYDESKRYRQDSSKDSRESQRLVLSSRLSNQKGGVIARVIVKLLLHACVIVYGRVYRYIYNHLMICSMYINIVMLLFVEMKILSIAKVTGPCLLPVTGSNEITCEFVVILLSKNSSCIVRAFLCA